MHNKAVAILLLVGIFVVFGEVVILHNNKPTFKTEFLRTKDVLSSDTQCEVTFVGNGQRNRRLDAQGAPAVVVVGRAMIHEIDHHHEEEEESGDTMYIFKMYSYSKEELATALSNYCPKVIYSLPEAQGTADEVVQIINSGPSDNRIDVVFMGDGYTAAQRELFLDDMKRLTSDMWSGVTFASYLPLFNVWGLYRPSTQSGIGVGGVPRNTAFGLYRDGTELRGIYTSKAAAARSACSATGVCDFPSLIGNDAFYGGLGGEFTISTASHTTGTIVLRHEFGHNFGDVGEEYNGGSAYFGANIASSANNIGWADWLTEPSSRAVQLQIQRIQSYAWYNLANGPQVYTFTSDGKYARSVLKFSVSGCEAPGSLQIELDGNKLLWNSTGILDRQFYTYFFNTPLAAGTHRLIFTGTPPTENQIRQLCNVEFLENGDETTFKAGDDYVGIYPTIASGGRAWYRSNNEFCLMRNMSSLHFCSVCQENMWHQFLSAIALIDDITIDESGSDVAVALHALKLAQFREKPINGEKYIVAWYKNGAEQTSLANSFNWKSTSSAAAGRWEVRIEFQTPEVRKDPNGYLKDSFTFTI